MQLPEANLQNSQANGKIQMSWLLNKLIESGSKNIPGKNSNRYDEDLMKFCTYLNIVSGPLAYEVLTKNLPVPSAKTVSNYMQKYKSHYKDGMYLKFVNFKLFFNPIRIQ